jgi:hypothetical protein
MKGGMIQPIKKMSAAENENDISENNVVINEGDQLLLFSEIIIDIFLETERNKNEDQDILNVG